MRCSARLPGYPVIEPDAATREPSACRIGAHEQEQLRICAVAVSPVRRLCQVMSPSPLASPSSAATSVCGINSMRGLTATAASFPMSRSSSPAELTEIETYTHV